MGRNMHAAGRFARIVLAAAAVWLATAVGAGTAGGVTALVFAGIMTATPSAASARSTCWPAASASAGS